MKKLAFAALIIFGTAITPAGASSSGQMYVYPKSDQSEEQQKLDRYECHVWAVEQTGFDPTAASDAAAPAQQQASGGAVKGAAKGAAAGAVIGEVANDDAAEGAAIGAASGAALGARKKRRQQRQAQAAQQQAAKQQQAALENYQRATATCLEARDYSVSWESK